MTVVISLVATLVSLTLTVQVGRQCLHRRRPYQLVWTAALGLFTIAVGTQSLAELAGWSSALYRLWYLSGAILAAAYLGQGSVYLMARRAAAHTTMALLALASAGAAVMVVRAPVDLPRALASYPISGHGMPEPVRLLTPFFNIYGTLALVGGAIVSVGRFLWNGGSGQRALGTALIGAGAIVVATGGTLTRFGIPGALYISELLAMVVIFAGFTLTARRSVSRKLDPDELQRRRHRVTRLYVSGGATLLLGLVAILPVLPWDMGIVTGAKHVYIATVPSDNDGAYLVTGQGVMELYPWSVEPATFPSDAPALAATSVHQIAVVQKQFDDPSRFQLYDLSTGQLVRWSHAEQSGTKLTLDLGAPLSPGRYVLVRPTDSMYGGTTWHYFQIE